MIIRVSATTYYFSHSKDGESSGEAQVCSAICTSYTNHLGSVALAAIAIPFFWLLKWTVVLLAQILEGCLEGC